MDDQAEETEGMEVENEQAVDKEMDDLSHSSKSSDEEDDDEEERKEQQLKEKIRELQKQVNQHPLYYDGHVALVSALRESGELLDARAAREEMNKHFPLSPELWLEWVKDEQRVCSSPEERAFITSLLERAVAEYASVEVWTEYLMHSVGGGDVAAAREVADRALAAVGSNCRDGDLVWQAVLMFETQLYVALPPPPEGSGKSPQQEAQAKKIQGLLRRRFRVPVLNMDASSLLEEADLWFEGNTEGHMKADLKKTMQKLRTLEPFEEKLLVTDGDPVLNVAAYEEYLQHVQDKEGPVQLQNLYERALCKHPVNAGLWEQYVQWCVQKFGDHESLVVPIARRAARNCPWSGPLCGLLLHALQRCCGSLPGRQLTDLHLDIKGVVETCLASLVGVEETFRVEHSGQMWLSYVLYLVRCIPWEENPASGTGDSNGSTTTTTAAAAAAADASSNSSSNGQETAAGARRQQMDRVTEACRRAVLTIRESSVSGPVPGDSDVHVCRVWAAVEARAGNMEAARAVWNDVLAQAGYTGRHDLWLEFIELERRLGSVKHTRKLYRRALERVWDYAEVVGSAFERFEQIEGDVDTMDDFYRRYRNRMVIVNKRRADIKAKESQKEAQIKANRKLKQKGKQPDNRSASTDNRNSAHHKDSSSGRKASTYNDKRLVGASPPAAKGAAKLAPPSAKQTPPSAAGVTTSTAAAAASVEPSSSSSVNGGSDVAPPPGYPGPTTAAIKRPLDETSQSSPAKRLKGAVDTDSSVQTTLLGTKVAAGQESSTVFVSNLDYSTPLETVTAVFRDCGRIKESKLVKDFKGRSKGFGFVVFESPSSMHKAIEKDRTAIGSRPMFVSMYEPDKQGHKFQYSTSMEKDKLFVRGLPYSMKEQEVKEVFEAHAPVSEIRLVTHRNGYSKGTCFIRFADAATAETVRQKMDQTELRGFTITVLISDPSAAKRQAVSKGSPDGKNTALQSGSGGSGANSIEIVRKPKLAFVPRALVKAAKPSTATKPAVAAAAKEGETGEAKPATKTNDDFRKMLMK